MAIVSEGFVRRFLPHQEALGKRIRQSEAALGNKSLEIVGVVGNVKYLGLAVDTDPAYYMSFAQGYGPRMFLVVRSSGDAARLAAALRQNIQSIDPAKIKAPASAPNPASPIKDFFIWIINPSYLYERGKTENSGKVL